MNVHLIIHNIVTIVSTITALGVAFFLFINGKKETANITFALVFFAAAIFYVSHVVGISVSDPYLSRSIFMVNLIILFIGVFNYHAVLAAINRDKEHKVLLASLYAAATVITIFFLIFPDLFFLPSVPKMYFTNYYNPGVLNWIRIAFLYGLMIPACIYELYREYKRALTVDRRNQIKYFMFTIIIGYSVSLLPNFLVYNIQLDPLWGISFAIVCAVPLIYGAIKYELFSVQVIAKQAVLYSLAVAAVGGFITMLNYSNVLITEVYPNFPTWTLALVSAVLAVSASIIVWRGLREGDLLKAEFITTVTHKFRTPLTYIKWAADNLENESISAEDKKAQIEYIRTANEKLVELTNILTTASDAESTKAYSYNVLPTDFSKMVEEVISSHESQLAIKKFKLIRQIEPGLKARFDVSRIKFVLQVLIENALHYSNAGGTITITARGTRKEVICSVEDTGLGLTPEQLTLLFSKFYRSDEARKLDTEGMGMGLYISARIMEKHSGRIWAESPGKGKGSMFSIALPRVR